MQIIIPMSGSGQRFLNAGYREPKPLIKVDGKPIIEHVVNLFPKEKNFIFICNHSHLKNTPMRSILKRIAPRGKIYGIPAHKKGPVYAVLAIEDKLDEEEETIVNYCDFSKDWDYQDFLKAIRNREADGAITAYRGFHPHMLNSPNYAFIKEEGQWMTEIREKQPFTNNKMQEYASDGTYYFKAGKYVKRYFKQLMDENINTDGEFYVSMIFNLMRRDNLKIAIYEIEHMLQWGTPRDLEEYVRWSNYFRKTWRPQKNIKPEKRSLTVVLLAGRGKRFIQEGYLCPKPLIEINSRPMVIQAVRCLPSSERYVFACLSEHLDREPLENEIRKVYPDAKIIRIDRVTEGQACTCEMALKYENLESPLLVTACDNGMWWDKDKYASLIRDPKVAAVVWTFRHHPSSERNPAMYGWVKVGKNDYIEEVSVKKQISNDPFNDHAIIGTFYFKKAKYFMDSLKKVYEKNTRVNNEFYIDTCINELLGLNLKVKVFEVEDYVGWGTPDDLKTYEYWQRFFHKCPWHPYSLNKDSTRDD